MEVIAKPKGGNIDKMTEKVFLKSIEMIGGLKSWLSTGISHGFPALLRLRTFWF